MARRYSEQEQYTKSFRAKVVLVLVALLLAMLAAKAFELQVVHGARYKQMAEENQIKIRRHRAPRGLILDRNGWVLADNRPSYDLAVIFSETPQDSAHVRRLAALAGVDTSVIAGGFAKAKRHPHEPVKIVRDIPFEAVARIEEQRNWLPGTSIEADPIRSYSSGAMACHLLGYQGEVSDNELRRLRSQGYRPGDYLGRTGVEEIWEAALRGTDGAIFIRVDAHGREVGPVRGKKAVQPRPGNNVFLTLDLGLQAAAEEAFQGVERGACVVLDPGTGEILAMVSRPSFDPNAFAGGINPEMWRVLLEDPALPLLSRAVSASYPPGSTFKIITSTCALQLDCLGDVPEFRPCFGGYRFGNRWFGCWKEGGHGRLDLRSAFIQSCDTFFYQVGERLTIDELSDCMFRFGFGKRTGIDLPSEATGLVPTRKWYDEKYGVGGWTQGLMLNLSIGQGEILATPLQMAAAVAVIGNGGVFWTPHLFLRLETPEGKCLREPRGRMRRVNIRDEILVFMQEAMLGVVEHERGTGRAARVAGVRVGGKTGTAQNPHGEDHALFVALAPVDEARVALAVVVENGGHGGAVAAPIAGKIMSAFFAMDQ
ncbi:MAG: penicillin-binding protein 2 [Candidatus Eisenbacteria sp.]|nr:penicillin-binding protein 2 [Candidatus Eisenbacteria bacterium]